MFLTPAAFRFALLRREKETGMTINGVTKNPDIGIQFASTETLLQSAQGQAQILNSDGGNLHDIMVTAPVIHSPTSLSI